MMDRLTIRDEQGNVTFSCENCTATDCADGLDCANAIADRLAAYEDTGLTPEGIKALYDSVQAIPAVDAVEVKHGYWKRVHDDVCYWSECSECGERQPLNRWRQEYESDYCPGCGARMDGGNQDAAD